MSLGVGIENEVDLAGSVDLFMFFESKILLRVEVFDLSWYFHVFDCHFNHLIVSLLLFDSLSINTNQLCSVLDQLSLKSAISLDLPANVNQEQFVTILPILFA